MRYLILEDGKVIADKEDQAAAIAFAEQRVSNSARNEMSVEIFEYCCTVSCKKIVTVEHKEDAPDAHQ